MWRNWNLYRSLTKSEIERSLLKNSSAVPHKGKQRSHHMTQQFYPQVYVYLRVKTGVQTLTYIQIILSHVIR